MSAARFTEHVRTQPGDQSGVVKPVLPVTGGSVLMWVAFAGVFMAMMLIAKSAYANTPVAGVERAQIEARVQALLTAYANDDQEAVVRMTDAHDLAIYGSDISEHATTPAGLRQMMTNDFKLWHTARFGKIQDLDIRIGRNLASAFFNVPFSAGGGPQVMVRLATVWRKVKGAWLLTQSANAVPTTGSSTAHNPDPGPEPVHHML